MQLRVWELRLRSRLTVLRRPDRGTGQGNGKQRRIAMQHRASWQGLSHWLQRAHCIASSRRVSEQGRESLQAVRQLGGLWLRSR